ncbi:MAG: DNA mismatch repair endonuclease MutL [Lachnospiraceae bacterium]|nr:DNA mismatch repair endonuclease MutL [Lachnospiraceae bacterium]
MRDIILLDDATINRIAAGEVVERPVSVVKELTENAIDSGAKNISVEIKGGGIDYIRVTDNGSGIVKDSIRTAFLRHATSKIRCADDLNTISSLGFRGEALSSVAAVAQVELMTKTPDSILGYRYNISGGREMSFDEAGVPDGTTVIVRNLFFNTPARKKFLKSPLTEANYVTQLMERLILSHPDISFKYTVNSDIKLSSSGNGDIQAGIYNIFGRQIKEALNPVSFESEECTVSGFSGRGEISRGNRNGEYFFVNGRFVKSRVLSAAAESAMSPYLMQHRYPFIILYIDIQSELIDVNVHPAKTEIRFRDEKQIYEIIESSVSASMKHREQIADALAPLISSEQDKPKAEDVPEPFQHSRLDKIQADPSYETPKTHTESTADPVFAESLIQSQKALQSSDLCSTSAAKPVQENLFTDGFLSAAHAKRHKLIGQVFDTYWIMEYEGKMYMMDQHAAHEKILYERFSKQIENNAVVSQIISPPYIVSLSLSQEEALKESLDAFSDIGFTIEYFGGREYALSSVPSELFRMSPQDYFISIIDELAADPKAKSPKQAADRIATMACKAAVKGNMRLSFSEADKLISDLFELDNPYNCPHGRPTLISFSREDIEKMFKRIV